MRENKSQSDIPACIQQDKSVLIAMSGGVDSTVAALLAQRAGYNCSGAVMKVFDGAGKTVSEAQAVADRLGMPFYEFNFIERFAKCVIAPFISDYRHGRTPNPCVVCNRLLKFGSFMEKAVELGNEVVVTGHYAQVERIGQTGSDGQSGSDGQTGGRYLLKKAADLSKDQSYVLYSLSQEQLSRVMFPLGGLTKKQVRETAADAGFDFSGKDESQDICFIPDGDYMSFIREYTGESPQKGRFIDSDGNDLGECNGIASYTIGQRRGLGLSMPHAPYVIELRAGDNTVVVGKEEMLYSKAFNAAGVNLIPVDKLDGSITAQVKIRYSDPGHTATVHQTGEDSLHIVFDEPQRAITKGQAAVIYDGDIVIGGGTII